MVARFVGAGNLRDARRLSSGQAGQARLALGDYEFDAREAAQTRPGKQLRVCLAPSAFAVVTADQPGISGRVEQVFFQGGSYAVDLSLPGPQSLSQSLVLPFEAQPRAATCCACKSATPG